MIYLILIILHNILCETLYEYRGLLNEYISIDSHMRFQIINEIIGLSNFIRKDLIELNQGNQ